jgi:hypothetical protein
MLNELTVVVISDLLGLKIHVISSLCVHREVNKKLYHKMAMNEL